MPRRFRRHAPAQAREAIYRPNASIRHLFALCNQVLCELLLADGHNGFAPGALNMIDAWILKKTH